MKHSKTQALIFLTYINKVLDDDFIRLEIRNLSDGENIKTKKYLNGIEEPSINKQEAKEILWAYNRLLYESKNIENALNKFHVGIDSIESARILNNNLAKELEKLHLPYS